MEKEFKTCKYCGISSNDNSHGLKCRMNEKEFNLSEKIHHSWNDVHANSSFFIKEDIKEKIQNAQKRLKEFKWFLEGEETWEDTVIRHDNEADRIFKEEFGDKLT